MNKKTPPFTEHREDEKRREILSRFYANVYDALIYLYWIDTECKNCGLRARTPIEKGKTPEEGFNRRAECGHCRVSGYLQMAINE